LRAKIKGKEKSQ